MIRGSSGTLEVTQAYAHGKPLTVLQGSGGMAAVGGVSANPGYLDERKAVKIEFVQTTSEAVVESEQFNHPTSG